MAGLHDPALDVASQVVGWIYFFAWSFSFYPQVWLNYSRKSVVGLSFDYQSYNLVGFSCYATFNVSMYFISSLQDEYREKNPGNSLPVELNDVFFAVHALLLTCITITQCFIYERGGQTVSPIGMLLSDIGWLLFYITLCLALTGVVTGLWFVYFLSYIKAGVTFVKYFPQAYLNFRNKSTEGWSIGNVLLDLTGGVFSFVQDFIKAINSGFWSDIYSNPTKLALSIFSIIFDLIFMFQHYVLYRNQSNKIKILDEETTEVSSPLKGSKN